MREILFRVKRTDNCEWVYGDLLTIPNENITSIFEQDPFGIKYSVIPETVGQFTGLKDKNGKKIFEGDIVSYTFDIPNDNATENGLKERISSVFWCEWRGSWSVYADERKGKGINTDIFPFIRNGNTVKVIGNIHDNPELLEV